MPYPEFPHRPDGFHAIPTGMAACLLSMLLMLPAYGQDSSSRLAGETGGKSQDIPILPGDVTIDGVMDESTWAQAVLIDDFHQYQPVEYAEPSQRTEVRLFYTEDALYIGARLWDSQADQIAAYVLRQGQDLGSDDVFAVILDPYLDRRNGYRFEVNPNSVRWEGLFQNVTELESSWNGIWQTRASRDDQGWTAEMRIPFQTLSFNPNSTSWGINFERNIRRNREDIAWISRNRQVNPGIAGTITGMERLQQGVGLDIVPSIITRQERVFGPAGFTDQTIEPQLDIYYKVTPQLNASLTFNTDFSATEVDNRQVNLTRFSLFFPEKRDFFVRDSDIFEFGQIGLGGGRNAFGNANIPGAAVQNGRPFFSRRIGLSPTGQPVDINAGAKLSGRVGDWNVGSLLINQADDPATGVNEESIFVGRAALNVLEESQVGVIATEGDPQSNLDNSLIGTDFRYRNSRLANGKTIEVSGFYQQTETEGKSGDDSSYGMVLNYPSQQGFNGQYRYKRVGENFDPAVGFVNQTAVEDQSVIATYRHFVQPGGFVRLLDGIYNWYQATSLENSDIISDVHSIRWIVEDNYADRIYGRFIQTKEGLQSDFRIYRSADGSRTVVIPQGVYDFYETMVGFTTGSQREFRANGYVRWGDYFTGKGRETNVGVNWQPSRNFQFDLSYTENDIELPQGDFTTRLFSFSNQVVFSSTLSWSNLIQYDNVSEEVGINSRLHWIPQAGRQAFLVLNYGLQDYDKDNIFESTNADLSLKFNYTFRF